MDPGRRPQFGMIALAAMVLLVCPWPARSATGAGGTEPPDARSAAALEAPPCDGVPVRADRSLAWPAWAEAYRDGEDLRPFRDGDRWGYEDDDGNVVIDPQIDAEDFFVSGPVKVKMRGKWGFIERNGRVVVPPLFEDAWPFSEGIARVKACGRWGYVDGSARLVIAPLFEYAWDFSGGRARVRVGDEIVPIDRSGRYVESLPAVCARPRSRPLLLAQLPCER